MKSLSFMSKKDLRKTLGFTFKTLPIKQKDLEILYNIEDNKAWEDIVNTYMFSKELNVRNNSFSFYKYLFQFLTHVKKDEYFDLHLVSDKKVKVSRDIQVNDIYVKFMNRHISSKSQESQENFLLMQDKMLHEKEVACLCVETNPLKSQNVKWEMTVDKVKYGDSAIRKISIDKFLKLLTNDDNAYQELMSNLPKYIAHELKYRNDIENIQKYSYILALYFLGL